jgi:hypothetical protein
LSELLKKDETLSDGVARYRHRLREHAADLHRVRGSPWPSSVAKAKMREQIEALAAAAAPNCDSAIEHGLPIGFVTKAVSAMVRNVEGPAISFVESPDALGLMCFLFRDQIVVRIEQELDAADDGAAMSERERQEAEAQIMADTLMIERGECALIWAAEERGDRLPQRHDSASGAWPPARQPTARQPVIGNVAARRIDRT